MSGEELRNYYVPFQAIGGVVVRAKDEEEAKELANERWGAVELARGGHIEDLAFDHKWGPGVEETKDPETAVPPEGTTAYIVQTTWVGIPEEPLVFFDREAAIREYIAAGVTGDVPFDEDRLGFDNSEAHHREVRIWKADVPTSPGQVAYSETEAEETAECQRIDALLAGRDPEFG